MLNTLAFVLAGSQELPGEDVDWQQLVGAQHRGPGLGRSLRISASRMAGRAVSTNW